MPRARRPLFLGLVSLFFLTSLSAAAEEDDPDEQTFPVDLSLVAEVGFNAPLHHTIQFSEDGSRIDYVEEGGQGVLFPFQRLSAEAALSDRHRLVFLWQPLQLQTQVRLQRDLTIDGATFSEGQPVDMLYNFPFFRASYLYDLSDRPDREIAIGPSVQLRNATIAFQTIDGELRRERRDVGVVPILKFRAQQTTESGWFMGLEADGFYAPIRYLNISDSDVLGAIWDVSLRAGAQVHPDVNAFLNLRYLGGGADGTSSDEGQGQPGDGYNRNWLNLLTLSLGFEASL